VHIVLVPDAAAGYTHNMKSSELKEQAGQGNVLLLDVRERDEYEAGEKIEGAQNMPMGRVFVEAKKGTLPKDRKIVTICQTGGRCEIVARELKQKGYDIEYLEGGIEAWRSQ
jgi:rhodanese-related sulfurtransferase